MKRTMFFASLLVLMAVACTATVSNESTANQQTNPTVTVYRLPTWGCCDDWSAYMEENDYPVQVEDVQDLSEINKQYQVPAELQSCHTAIVDGYIITGHVPVQEVNRLLAERPGIIGLAVAGMPIGSPGMEMTGVASQPFDVVAFDGSGAMEVFASYNP